MKRLFWVGLAIVISSSIYFTIRYGLRPKPIPILNPTEFESPDQIGAVAYRALRQVVGGENLVVLGLAPDVAVSAEVWNGFFKTAIGDGVKWGRIFVESGVSAPPALGAIEVVNFSEDDLSKGAILDQFNEGMKSGHAVAIQIPTNEASHLVLNSLTRKLEKLPNNPLLSISIVPWSFNTDTIEAWRERCDERGEDGKQTRRLACAQYKLSRKFLKKKLDPHKMWAAMERHGLKEYLVFVHQPE